MKTFKFGLLCGLGALAASQASANLVINGDFSAGNADFTSGYTYIAPAGQGSLYPEGAYTVTTDPNSVHNLWASFGDHTGNAGNGNMMIVNGAASPINVWQGNLSSPLVAGQTYEFSVWVANLYPPPVGEGTIPVAPAQLKFSIGGTQIGNSFTATGVGFWQEFTTTFVAGSGDIAVLDLNLLPNGNDFALDDFSLTAVPEPSTIFAGALMLLPLGVSALRIVRKNRAA